MCNGPEEGGEPGAIVREEMEVDDFGYIPFFLANAVLSITKSQTAKFGSNTRNNCCCISEQLE